MLTITLALGGVVALSGAAPTETLIDFEGLVHGEIVNSQFSADGLQISAFNPNRDFDLAVAFDSTRHSTRDPDLEDPFTGGNLPKNTRLGNLLIIQENDEIKDGIATLPDDEGSRPAGQIILNFDTPIETFGFDVVDLEDAVAEFSYVDFFNDGQFVGLVSFADFAPGGAFDQGAQFGDNSANRVAPIDIVGTFGQSADRVILHAGGSMGFDNLVYRAVPTPGTAALIAAGGLMTFRRRRDA